MKKSKITHNGKTLEFEPGTTWKKSCPQFENKEGEGWFLIESDVETSWNFVRNFQREFVISETNQNHSGFFWEDKTGMTHWTTSPNLTKEEVERRLKLETFK